MKYAIDCYAGDDWGAPDHETDYIYATRDEAEAAATQWMRDQITTGESADLVGCYVVSDLRDEADNPLVEDLLVVHDGWIVNRSAEDPNMWVREVTA